MSAARRAGRWLLWLALAAIALVLLLQLWYLGWVLLYRWIDPRETAFMAREREQLQAASAKAELKQRWTPYARISPALKRSVVAAEDANFVEHDGVEWDAIQKAYESNRSGRRKVRGGSTISQQLAKNLFLSPERSYVRKGQELLITYMIEALWDKRRILEVYLNVAEWGVGVFGAEAAAQHYFGTSAARLDAWQAARLAAMLPRPKFYDRNRGSAYLVRRAGAIARFAGDAQIP